jgi:hypothetical protein
MAEFMLILLMLALVRSIFFPWGSPAICRDIFGMAKGGGGGAQSSQPSYTVSPGLSATPFGRTGAGGTGSSTSSLFSPAGGGTSGGAPPAPGVSSTGATPQSGAPSLGGSSVGRSTGDIAATFTSQPDGTHVLNIPNGGIYFLGAPSPTPNSVGSSTGRSSNPASSSNFLGIGQNKG